jgi:hypothetical protein
LAAWHEERQRRKDKKISAVIDRLKVEKILQKRRARKVKLRQRRMTALNINVSDFEEEGTDEDVGSVSSSEIERESDTGLSIPDNISLSSQSDMGSEPRPPSPSEAVKAALRLFKPKEFVGFILQGIAA